MEEKKSINSNVTLHTSEIPTTTQVAACPVTNTVMKSLFGRKKKDEIPNVEEVEDPDASKESLQDIAENPVTEAREELFRGMETEVRNIWGNVEMTNLDQVVQDNGLFEGMETLQRRGSNNNMNIGLLGDGDRMKMQPRDEEEDDYDEDDDDDDDEV